MCDEIIKRDHYFLIIDNQDGRKLTMSNFKTQKLGKRELNVEYFEGKNLNSFWALEKSDDKSGKTYKYKKESYTEITHREFFGESLSKITNPSRKRWPWIW